MKKFAKLFVKVLLGVILFLIWLFIWPLIGELFENDYPTIGLILLLSEIMYTSFLISLVIHLTEP